jgi:signal transduction histidine kinase
MPPLRRKQFWRYVRGLAAPVILWGLFAAVLVEPLQTWLHGDEEFDEAALREWIEEARVFRETLPEMTRGYLAEAATADWNDESKKQQVLLKAEQIREHLKALGDSSTKMYQGQLPLFPIIYRLEVILDHTPREMAGAGELPALVWDSELPRHPTQYQELWHGLSPGAWLVLHYQLHAYNKRQQNEEAVARRLRSVSGLAVSGTALALLWVYLVQRRERERQQQQALAREQIDRAERLVLEKELHRQEAERRQEDTERKLLEQRLATQAAEQQALELKSRLYANIGIMAGSYAHNIKNLLVRPNDLLRRCLEADRLAADQDQMLREVRQTLGTVTDRLQQILRTVRRDPNRSEPTRLDLNQVVREIECTWQELARDKWKLSLTSELSPEALAIEGDLSHLQQMVENLLFNARDATFEMRNHLREQARRSAKAEGGGPAAGSAQALIAAAGWRGSVVLRTRRQAERTVLEVQDNGIGMTEDVRRRCTETHFSTKRDNAVYAGDSTGMGLGLSFVETILKHHHATLEIESEPLRGALFRVSFPLTE